MAGKIIKGEGLAEAPAQRPRVLEGEVYDARQRASAIVLEAKAEAERIVRKAQEEREGALASAREQGFQEGLAQATEQLARAHAERGRMLEGMEREVVELSCRVAERILGRELEADPQAIVGIVAQAIESVRQQRELVLRVSPSDARILRESRARLLDLVGRAKDLSIREDPAVAAGGCVVETEAGTIDARLETQLEMLERALKAI